jgi:hypothetical protein
MNRPKEKQHQAFLDDIRAAETKHGLKLAVDQPPPRIVIVPIEEDPVDRVEDAN